MGTTPNEGHEGAAQPMMSLQGGTGPVFTQMPSDQSMNYENVPRGDYSSNMPAGGNHWDETVIAGGMQGGATASTRDTSNNGMRPEPSPA